MENKFIATAKHAIVFGIGSIGKELIGFILLPIYTRLLSPSDYGVLTIITTVSNLLRAFLTLGLSTSIFRFFFYSNEIRERKSLISSALIFLVLESLIILLIFVPFSVNSSSLLFNSSEYSQHLTLALITLCFSNLQIIPLALLRAEKKSLQFGIYSLINFVVILLLRIWLVVGKNYNIYGILLADCISSVIFSALGIYLSRIYLVKRFDLVLLRRMFVFGFPLVFSQLLSLALAQSDRFFIKHFLDTSQVGFYTLAYQIGVIVNVLLVGPFQLIWLPSSFETYKPDEENIFFSKTLIYFGSIVAWFAFGISAWSREVLLVMSTPTYYWVYTIVPFIAYSYFFYGLYMVVNIGVYIKNRTQEIALLVGISALINVLLNIILIPLIGLIGAASANLSAYFALFTIAGLRSRKFRITNYNWTKLALLLGVSIFCLVINILLFEKIENLIFRLLLKTAMLFVYWILLLGFKVIEKYQIRELINQINQIISKLKWVQQIKSS